MHKMSLGRTTNADLIKNTPFIYSLYDGHGLTIKSFDKKYQVSFMNRNDKQVEHLIIKNY